MNTPNARENEMIEELANLYGLLCGAAALNRRAEDGMFELPVNEEIYRRAKTAAAREMKDGEVEPSELKYTWALPMRFPIDHNVTEDEGACIFEDLMSSMVSGQTPFAKAVKLNPEVGFAAAVDPDVDSEENDVVESISRADQDRWNAAVNEILVVASKYPVSHLFRRIRRHSSRLPLLGL